MNVNLIYYKDGRTYKNKEGKEVESYSFALELQEGVKVVIKNVYKDDHRLLRLFAEKKD